MGKLVDFVWTLVVFSWTLLLLPFLVFSYICKYNRCKVQFVYVNK